MDGQLTDPHHARERAYRRALEVADRLLGELEGFPHTTRHGCWRVSAEGRWTAGFWIGLIWLLYLEVGDERVRDAATHWLGKLRFRETDTTTHDMGFLFEPSFVRGFNITGEQDFRDAGIQAARSLATRFHSVGGYIQAWDESEDPIHCGRTIVDTVMNLPLLIWAARAADEPNLAAVAEQVAQTTAHYHVRSDGSTYHVVDFGPGSGRPLRSITHQGYADESCWSRGQAWALYGFCKLHLLTGDLRWLDVSQRVADFFLTHLPEDNLPYWDFRLPDTAGEPRDSSAAAIAASALLDLATCAHHVDASTRYRRGAERLLDALILNCLSQSASGQQGILLHATHDRPRNSAVDESIIFGDHYFVEALTKLLHPDRRPLLDAVGDRAIKAPRGA